MTGRRLINLLSGFGLLFLVALALGCGGSAREGGPPGEPDTVSSAPLPAEDGAELGSLPALPRDVVQPWEELTEEGFVSAESAGDFGGLTGLDPLARPSAEAKGTSAISSASRYVVGATPFDQKGTTAVVDGEAAGLSAPSGDTAWAVYRLVMEGREPVMLTTDINLPPGASYWVGVANYGLGRWEWLGPYADGRLRLALEPLGSRLSPLGNAFVAVVTQSADPLTIVGVGLEQEDSADTTAPATPAGLTATPVPGGVLLEWDPVGGLDLAGYRLYWSGGPFDSPSRAAATTGSLIVGRTDYLFRSASPTPLHFRVAAVDVQGNESPLSEEAVATPLPPSGDAPSGALTVDRVAGLRGLTVSLDASSLGGASYDWDLDGDGLYDETESPDSTKSVTLPETGLWRPAVRVRDSEGNVTLMSAVTVIIVGNLRPIVVPTADPQSGPAPLTSLIKAGFRDDDGEVVDVRLDLDGDGVYETDISGEGPATLPTPSGSITYTNTFDLGTESYALFNVNVRVVDDGGSQGFGSVGVQVMANQPPVVDFTISPTEGIVGLNDLVVNAAGSYDPDGSPDLEFLYDPNGDYGWVASSSPDDPVYSFTLEKAGTVMLGVRVTDSDGLMSELRKPYLARKFTPIPVDTKAAADSPSVVNHDLALIGGKPAIVFNDANGGECKYLINTMGDGTGFWRSTTLSTDECRNPSLREINGVPMVASFDSVNDIIMLFVANSSSGVDDRDYLGWDSYSVFGSVSGIGDRGISLAEVNGFPAIAHTRVNPIPSRLYFSINDQPDGSGAWTTTVVGSGSYNSVTLVTTAGLPAIAARDNSANALVWFINSQPDGSGTWTKVTVENSAGTYASAVVNRFQQLFPPATNYIPMIAYVGSSGEIKLAVSSTDTGDSASDWSTQVVDDGADGEVGMGLSMTLASSSSDLFFIFSGNQIFIAYTIKLTGSTDWFVKVAFNPNGDASGPWSFTYIDQLSYGCSIFGCSEIWLKLSTDADNFPMALIPQVMETDNATYSFVPLLPR